MSVNYHDGRRIGAVLVDSDGLAYVVLIDGTLEETPGRCQVALASECEVDRLAVWPFGRLAATVNAQVPILPSAFDLNVVLVDAQAPAY